MIATLPTQERVDETARQFALHVVRIRCRIGRGWSDDPAIYFRVLLSDRASQRDHFADLTGRVSTALFAALGLAVEHIPYLTFRNQSEQAALKNKEWE